MGGHVPTGTSVPASARHHDRVPTEVLKSHLVEEATATYPDSSIQYTIEVFCAINTTFPCYAKL